MDTSIFSSWSEYMKLCGRNTRLYLIKSDKFAASQRKSSHRLMTLNKLQELKETQLIQHIVLSWHPEIIACSNIWLNYCASNASTTKEKAEASRKEFIASKPQNCYQLTIDIVKVSINPRIFLFLNLFMI